MPLHAGRFRFEMTRKGMEMRINPKLKAAGAAGAALILSLATADAWAFGRGGGAPAGVRYNGGPGLNLGRGPGLPPGPPQVGVRHGHPAYVNRPGVGAMIGYGFGRGNRGNGGGYYRGGNAGAFDGGGYWGGYYGGGGVYYGNGGGYYDSYATGQPAAYTAATGAPYSAPMYNEQIVNVPVNVYQSHVQEIEPVATYRADPHIVYLTPPRHRTVHRHCGC
jgi:hypothetical protein